MVDSAFGNLILFCDIFKNLFRKNGLSCNDCEYEKKNMEIDADKPFTRAEER